MPETTSNNNVFFRQFLFILVLIAIGAVICVQLGFLLSCFLGAITIYVLLRLLSFKLIEKKHWKPWIASLFLVVLTTLGLLGIGFIIFELVASQIPALDTSLVIDGISKLINNVNDYAGYPLISKNLIYESKDILAKTVSGLFNTTYNFALNLFLMVVVLYFMLSNGRKMESKVVQYIPFKGESLNMIKKEVKDMILGNAVGIPVIMLAQGIVSSIGYWIAGVDNILFWGFLTAIFGLIPIVGTGAIWLPAGVYLVTGGNIWQGIVLVLYGFLAISNTDNLCRMLLLKKMANTHPLTVIFGVILGIPLFGFWGIIFGPLLISGFLLLIRIYYMEYGTNKNKS